MSKRRRQRSTGILAVVIASAAIMVSLTAIAACVPTPAGRATSVPSGSAVAPSAASTPTVGPTAPTPAPTFIRPTPLPEPTFLAYEVKAGDTLTSIARAFSTTPLSIGYWNRTTYPSLDPDSADYAPDRIAIGWTLLLIPDRILDGSDLPESLDSPDPPGSADPTPS
jgi:hypothetical protein